LLLPCNRDTVEPNGGDESDVRFRQQHIFAPLERCEVQDLVVSEAPTLESDRDTRADTDLSDISTCETKLAA